MQVGMRARMSGHGLDIARATAVPRASASRPACKSYREENVNDIASIPWPKTMVQPRGSNYVCVFVCLVVCLCVCVGLRGCLFVCLLVFLNIHRAAGKACVVVPKCYRGCANGVQRDPLCAKIAVEGYINYVRCIQNYLK